MQASCTADQARILLPEGHQNSVKQIEIIEH